MGLLESKPWLSVRRCVVHVWIRLISGYQGLGFVPISSYTKSEQGIFFCLPFAHVSNFSSVAHQIFIPTCRFHGLDTWKGKCTQKQHIAERNSFFEGEGRRTRKRVTNVHVQLIELVHTIVAHNNQNVLNMTLVSLM